MVWYHFVAYFFAGMFLVNGIPHYVLGVAGRVFPTPFASPPGVGRSGSLVNVFWGLANFVIAYLLLQVGTFTGEIGPQMSVFFVGVLIMSVMAAKRFSGVYANT
mgnify:FL=1